MGPSTPGIKNIGKPTGPPYADLHVRGEFLPCDVSVREGFCGPGSHGSVRVKGANYRGRQTAAYYIDVLRSGGRFIAPSPYGVIGAQLATVSECGPVASHGSPRHPMWGVPRRRRSVSYGAPEKYAPRPTIGRIVMVSARMRRRKGRGEIVGAKKFCGNHTNLAPPTIHPPNIITDKNTHPI